MNHRCFNGGVSILPGFRGLTVDSRYSGNRKNRLVLQGCINRRYCFRDHSVSV